VQVATSSTIAGTRAGSRRPRKSEASTGAGVDDVLEAVARDLSGTVYKQRERFGNPRRHPDSGAFGSLLPKEQRTAFA
jgi:hypothetical protein